MSAELPQPYSSHGPIARINLAALKHNFQRCRELNPNRPIMPVVKANAYGHGAVEVASALVDAGADSLCVARLNEALPLREAGIDADIVILEGIYSATELAIALKYRLTLVLHDADQISALPDSIATNLTVSPQRVWLKLETGMHRLGASLESAAELASKLRSKSWCSEVGWLTHLASADETDSAATDLQVATFKAFAAQHSGPISIANSAATATSLTNGWPSDSFLRPGILLYGSSPLQNRTADDLNLQPVMSLETPLLAVKSIAVGSTVGYGAIWQATRPTVIGIAAIGYGDGYPRSLSSCDGKPDAQVWISGRRCPVIGRVSMDKIAIDLTDLPGSVSTGEPVQLWGDKISVDEVARRAGTISYELLSGVTPRVPRVY